MKYKLKPNRSVQIWWSILLIPIILILFSFMNMDWDPKNWDEHDRFFAVLIYLACLMFIYKEDFNEDA
jgi:hypothetical protein